MQRIAEDLLERGVYRAPYLVGGRVVLFVVDRHGAARKHVKLEPTVSEDAVVQFLEAWLEDHDPDPMPGPHLTLIKPVPPSPPAAPSMAVGEPGWPYTGDKPPAALPAQLRARPFTPIKVY